MIKSLSIGAVCLLLTTVMIWAGFVQAAVVTTNHTQYTVTFGSGSYSVPTISANNTVSYPETAVNIFTQVGTATLSETAAESIILPATFAQVADPVLYDKYKSYFNGNSVWTNTYVANNDGIAGYRLDEETFWFDMNKNYEAGWYSFTGWQISGTTERIPGVTVFQPGDVIPVDTLSQYAADGSLELQAVWGKCYFIQNGHTNMVYHGYAAFHRDNTYWYVENEGTANEKPGRDRPVQTGNLRMYCTTCSTGVTGATDILSGNINDGSSPNVPMQTIENLYDQLWNDKQQQYDPYTSVAMLTGDLDLVHLRSMVDAGNASGVQYPCIAETRAPTQTAINNIWEYTFNEHVMRLPGSGSTGRRFAATYIAQAMTFKSLQTTRTYDASTSKVSYTRNSGATYTFSYKCFDDEGNFRGSMRFDNVALTIKYDTITDGKAYFGGEACGNIVRLYNGDRYNPNDFNNSNNGIGSDLNQKSTVFECTARVTMPANGRFPFGNFRAYQAFSIKLSGGSFGAVSYSWADRTDGGDAENPTPTAKHDRYCYIGRNAVISNLYMGSVQNEGDTTVGYWGDAYVTITGGRVDGFYGTSVTSSNAAPCRGNRYVRIYGDKSTNTQYNPDIDYVFAGGNSADLLGDVYLTVRGATKMGQIYGGGQNGTSVVYGNTEVYVADSSATYIYGGGLYGNVEKNGSSGGNISVTILNSTVTKSVFGIGSGSTSYVDSTTNHGAKYNDAAFMAEWVKPLTTYPYVNTDSNSGEYGFVTNIVRKAVGFVSGGSGQANGLNYRTVTRKYFLSPASAENVDIVIQNSTVNGDVYGGGEMSYVKGNTTVKVTGTSYVGGMVLGGSKGGDTAAITSAKVPIYRTLTQTEYIPAAATVNGSSATITKSDDNGDAYKLGNYSWSSEAYLLGASYNGIDHTNKLVYSPYVEMLGNVGGTTTVTVEGSANVGIVYGGGYSGNIAGLATVNITSGNVRRYVVAGCVQGAVNGGTKLTISGGTVGENVYAGGDSGAVNGNVALNITGGTMKGNVFGGGYAGAVNGNVAIQISGGDLTGIDPSASDQWTSSCNSVYGGGNKGDVNGNITWTITGGRFGWIFGGGFTGDVKDITFNITGDQPTSTSKGNNANTRPCVIGCFRGAGQSGAAEDVTISIAGGYYYRNFFCGPDGASATCASTTLTTTGGAFASNIFGGGDTGSVTGSTNLTMGANTLVHENVFGGGDRAPSKIGGNTSVTINSAVIGQTTNCGVYGGGRRGTVTGNTSVTVNSTANGSPLLFVHGAGDGSKYGASTNNLDDDDYNWDLYGNVGGTATVTINGGTVNAVYGGASGGTVGNANHNYTDGVYQGGHVKGTTVNLKGGSVGNVFGGGKSGGNVDGNATINITGGTVTENVLGGNNAGGNINGNTYINLTSGSAKYIYGGNQSNGKVTGSTNVNLKGMTVYDIFGGNLSGGTVSGAANVTLTSGVSNYVFGGNNAGGTVGSAALLLSGGTINNVAFGGNLSSGEIVGNVLINQGAVRFNAPEKQDNVSNENDIGVMYGGNMNGGTISGNVQIDSNAEVRGTSTSNRNIFGGNYGNGIIKGNVTINNTTGYCYVLYGGSDENGEIRGNVTVNLPSTGSINRVFGGGRIGGTIKGDVTINYNTTGWEVTGGPWKGGIIEGKITVNMTGGRVQNTLAGGGKNAHITADTDSITINVTGGHIAHVKDGSGSWENNGTLVGGSRGNANNPANCAAPITINIGKADGTSDVGFIRFVYGGCANGSATAGTVINVYDGSIQNLFGGSNEGSVSGTAPGTDVSAQINFHNGVTGALNGGGNNAVVTGNTEVNFYNGTVDKTKLELGGAVLTSTMIQRFCGGGYAANVTGNTEINMVNGTVACSIHAGGYNGAVGGNTNLTIQGGDITGSVFGGGYSGAVGVDSNVTLYDANITASVFGGGQNGDVNGNTHVTIDGAVVGNSVFGGGDNGKVLKDTYVTLLDGTFGDADNESVFAGGNGAGATVSGNTNLTVTGGTYAWDIFGGGNSGVVTGSTNVLVNGAFNANALYGGGKLANVGSTNVEVTGNVNLKSCIGGGYQGAVVGNTSLIISNGTFGAMFGGGYDGAVGGNTSVVASDGIWTGALFGGGKGATATVAGDSYVGLSGGEFRWDVFGGGENGAVEGDVTMEITGGTIANALYGGGSSADVSSVQLTISGAATRTKYMFGGGYNGVVKGDVVIVITDGATVSNELCGGGYGATATVESVDLTITNGAKLLGADGTFAYGGGRNATVNGDVNILIGGNSQITPNFYGGGKDAPVKGTVTLNITGASFGGNVYGGGKNGVVNKSIVAVTDSGTAIAMFAADPDLVEINGNLFGGGEGQTASVVTDATVIVDLKFDFTVTEQAFSTTEISDSGATKSEYAAAPGTWSVIKGNVYGGGDMGRVGNGTIYNNGSANVAAAGSTTVEIRNGQILGHVFAGGCGIPSSGLAYNTYMGTVFGSTDLLITGGYVGGNVYGGGQQSRVYSAEPKNLEVLASSVRIVEIEGKKIAINGSVFGGGDRGDSESANASIPTTVGNVAVSVVGVKDKQPSDIYFLNGGVYGDGNLCLVNGNRQITLKDFEPSADKTRVKTFYSLQRADKVILDNSAVVLLGAIDLVEEGDTAVYSINRVGQMEMLNGSVLKLDQIVKYLGGLISDVHGATSESPRKYIHLGNNGSNGPDGNGYHDMGCDGSCLDPLTEDDIDAYRNCTATDDGHVHTEENKNVVCVANGLYLEIMGEDDEYGPVTGLFTLSLLNANPGEGGGFVYGSILESTGDFICETKEWAFANAEVSNAEQFAQQLAAHGNLYTRVSGKAYQTAKEYIAGQTYYYRDTANENDNTYMEIIDDVGGLENDVYSYYYWYIGGPSVTYSSEIIGYIGTNNTQFTVSNNIPLHESPYDYVLFDVSVNDILANAVGNSGNLQLVQSANVTGNQIAIELKHGNTSMGFLTYEDGKWGMKLGSTVMYGYEGDAVEAKNNVLGNFAAVVGSDQLTWVLHKSTGVANTISDMEVYLDIDLYTDAELEEAGMVSGGTTVLSFTNNMSIIRLVPLQNLYHDSIRGYDGVGTTSAIHITGDSCFTAEYQTKYVPAAFPGISGTNMKWVLSTQNRYYYVNGDSFVTLDASGKIVGCSDDIAKNATVVKNGNGTITVGGSITMTEAANFESENKIPAGTKITMIDLTGETPGYYYYICAEAKDTIDLTSFLEMGSNKAITDAAAFLKVYDDQIMDQITERILFVFDFSDATYTNATVDAEKVLAGGIVFQHLFDGTDIMDHVKNGTTRSAPKDVAYRINTNPAVQGVNSSTYTATIEQATAPDNGNVTLQVRAEEDPNWTNTMFRENGFAFKIQLQNAQGQPVAMPAGMYAEFKGNKYYPGRDSTFISVPVHEFGAQEITIHNPNFSLEDAVGGTTVKYVVDYYSAPDANFYNSFYTGEREEDTYTITANSSKALRITIPADGSNRVLKTGEALKFNLQTKYNPVASENDPRPWVQVSLYHKGSDGKYNQVENMADVIGIGDTETLPASPAGTGYSYVVSGNAVPGTYRLMFRYGGHTEYLNFIVLE